MNYDVECPLLNRTIDNGYCYEVTIAAYGMVKMEFLDDKIEREVALKHCEKCKHNQVK
jgi:hypothetical protein